MKPTKEQVMSIMENFYQVCKNDHDKGVHYFAGFLMSSFASIAEHPERMETQIELIKEQTQRIKDENK